MGSRCCSPLTSLSLRLTRLGAVLTQQVEGVDRPVLYISRKLSQRETKYSTVEKECLAVGSLCYYLLGRPFTLCSDHVPLQWLHHMKDTNDRITRWYLALQPFNFNVVHRLGARMVVVGFSMGYAPLRRGGVDRYGLLPQHIGRHRVCLSILTCVECHLHAPLVRKLLLCLS